MPTHTVATQLVIAKNRIARLTLEAVDVTAELGRLSEHYDSARLGSALGMLSTAAGLLADIQGELHQAAQVASTLNS